MTLPTTAQQSTRRDPRMLLLYGPPKIGKTTMLSQLPNRSLTMETDPRGAEFVSICHIQLNTLEDYVEATKQIRASNPKPYDFLAIDTIDKLEEWSEAEATKLYKSIPQGKTFTGDSVLNLPNGGGYLYLRQVFLKCVSQMLDLADNIIIVGHIRDKMIESVGGKGEVNAKDLDLTGKIKAIVCSMVDGIGYVSRNAKSELTVSFMTREEVICGSRCPHLKGQVQTHGVATFDWSKIYPDYFQRLEQAKTI